MVKLYNIDKDNKKDMLIIFEGPDGAGKSTLINKLKRNHLTDALVCKRSSFKTYNPEESNYPMNIDLTQSALWDWRFFLEMMGQSFISHNIMCDRSYITQRVYQDVTGVETKTELLDKTLIALEKETLKLPHILVYCRSKYLRNDGDFKHMDNKEISIIHRYEKYIKDECILNKIVIDTDTLDEDSSVSLILGAIQAGYSHYINTNNKTPLNICAD